MLNLRFDQRKQYKFVKRRIVILFPFFCDRGKMEMEGLSLRGDRDRVEL